MIIQTGKRWLVQILVMAGVAAAVAGATIGFAQEGNGDEIHACVSDGLLLGLGEGSMRIVDDASACGSNESALTWNVQGIQGEQG
ncbi:MAG: hypothetical protein GEU75_17680, partial [Dehalococcoidia bacterium]|nr:hypothetical protein [Dehalococcoidia bacterium]